MSIRLVIEVADWHSLQSTRARFERQRGGWRAAVVDTLSLCPSLLVDGAAPARATACPSQQTLSGGRRRPSLAHRPGSPLPKGRASASFLPRDNSISKDCAFAVSGSARLLRLASSLLSLTSPGPSNRHAQLSPPPVGQSRLLREKNTTRGQPTISHRFRPLVKFHVTSRNPPEGPPRSCAR